MPNPASDLDDDILEELKSIGNLLERVASSNERMEKMFQQSMQMYAQLSRQ